MGIELVFNIKMRTKNSYKIRCKLYLSHKIIIKKLCKLSQLEFNGNNVKMPGSHNIFFY